MSDLFLAALAGFLLGAFLAAVGILTAHKKNHAGKAGFGDPAFVSGHQSVGAGVGVYQLRNRYLRHRPSAAGLHHGGAERPGDPADLVYPVWQNCGKPV